MEIETNNRTEVLDVTDAVERVLPDGATGSSTVFVEHTTCGVVINEGERRLLSDIETALGGLVPDADYAHDEIDDNAAAHLRAMLLGPAATVPVEDGSLALGTWQSVLLVECDGPRTRRLRVL